MNILHSVTLHDKNTFRIGGPAQYYAEPADELELLETLHWAVGKRIPIFILGKGSNVLISDQGWPGLVVNLSVNLTGINWVGNVADVQGGTLLNTLVYQAVSDGKTGIEELAGIPGTVGGAVIMNAGAFTTCVADVLTSVRYFDFEKDEIQECESTNLSLGYRTSALKGKNTVILNARFHFSKGEPELVTRIRQDTLTRRKMKQPVEFPNCGSVFKRPAGNFAGTLIEQCGLKGFRIGGVEVSSKHANFIINRGDGTASDVFSLIYKIQESVFNHSGILLEPEVLFIGEFGGQLFMPPESSGVNR